MQTGGHFVESKRRLSRISLQNDYMKTSLLGCFGSIALALSALAQTPTPPALEAAPPSPPAAPAVAPSPPPAVPTPTIAIDEDEDLEQAIDRKVRRGLSGVNITFGDEKKDRERRVRTDRDIDENVERAIESRIEERIERGIERSVGDGALMAIPIVGVIFATLFGAPVAIVGVIMFFSYIKARSLHKTVRMMVEKGQPVPESLFAAPHTPAKVRSDMRRGITLVMIGLGMMLFLAAVNEFDGGAWALGLIPFMIGAGYLAIWVMEGNKITFDRTANDHTTSTNAGTDTPPPLP